MRNALANPPTSFLAAGNIGALCGDRESGGEWMEDAGKDVAWQSQAENQFKSRPRRYQCTFRRAQGAIPTSSADCEGNPCTVVHKGRNNGVSFPSSQDSAQLWTLQLWGGSSRAGYRNSWLVLTTTLQSPALTLADCCSCCDRGSGEMVLTFLVCMALRGFCGHLE